MSSNRLAGAGSAYRKPRVASRQKHELRRRFGALAAGTVAAVADELGDALLLLDGGSLTRQAFGSDKGPQHPAARAARLLVDAYAPRGV